MCSDGASSSRNQARGFPSNFRRGEAFRVPRTDPESGLPADWASHLLAPWFPPSRLPPEINSPKSSTGRTSPPHKRILTPFLSTNNDPFTPNGMGLAFLVRAIDRAFCERCRYEKTERSQAWRSSSSSSRSYRRPSSDSSACWSWNTRTAGPAGGTA